MKSDEKRKRPRRRTASVQRDPVPRPTTYPDDDLLAELLRILPGTPGDGRPLVRAMLAWRHGNPAGAVEAVRFCGEQRRPLPDALWRWVLSVLEDHVSTLSAPEAPRKGRYARWGNAHEQHRQKIRSWRALRDARASGLKGVKATEAAAKHLAAHGLNLGHRAIENGFYEVEHWRGLARPSRLQVTRRFYPDDES